MSFADFAEGFADGFIPAYTARIDRQAQQDEELAKIRLQQKGKLYESRAEQERAARELRRQAENLYSMTGIGDVGAFYQMLEAGMKPTDIISQAQTNPNLFQQIGGNTSPTRAPANVQTPFEQGVDAMDQFGGPTVEAGAALEARRAAAPAVDLAPRDVDLLARTIIGEAASEPIEGKIAVANVVMNRIQSGRFGGSSMQDVLFARNQFEPWTNPATRNRLMNISTDSPEYQEAFRIAQAVTGGTVPDVTNGATHFANPDIVRRYHQEGKATNNTLAWVQNIEQNGTRIGRHVFGNADAGANSRQTTMSTGGSINPTDQQMEGAFSEPTVVPEMRMPEPEAERSQGGMPDNLFTTAMGWNQAQRDRDIDRRVSQLSEAAGFTDMPSGFASPPQSNFRLNLGGGGADLSQLVGKNADFIDQWMVINGGNLSANDIERVGAMRGIANRTEDKPFNVFNEIRGAYSDNKLNAVFDYVSTSPEFSEEEREENLAVLGNVMERREQASTGDLLAEYQNDMVRYLRMMSSGTNEERQEASRWFNEEKPIIEAALSSAGQIETRAEAMELQQLGFDPNVAMLAALGHLDTIADPVTRQIQVIASDGKIVGSVPMAGQSETAGGESSSPSPSAGTGQQTSPTVEPSPASTAGTSEHEAALDAAREATKDLLEEFGTVDLSRALGLPGRLRNVGNTVDGVLGRERSSNPETAQAYRLLENLGLYTNLAVISAQPNLRGSVTLLGLLENLNLRPGSFTTAEDAMMQLSTTRQRLDDIVRELEKIDRGETGATPKEVGSARITLPEMRTLRDYYLAAERSFDLNRTNSSGRDFLGNQGATTQTEAAPEAEPEQNPLDLARDAIARGADRDAVIQRLIENDIDPSGL